MRTDGWSESVHILESQEVNEKTKRTKTIKVSYEGGKIQGGRGKEKT